MEPGWWDKKKHEWLYKQEMARKQRQARKYAKLQAKEVQRARREMQGTSPTVGQRYAEWKRKRELSKQQRAEQMAALEDDKSFRGLLNRHDTKIFWSFALIVILGLGAVITREVRRSEFEAAKKAEEKRTLAKINGKPIYVDTVLDRLFFAHGAAMLQELSEQEAVRQEAEKQGIELSSDDQARIEALLKNSPQKRVQKPRLEMSFRLRKLILKDVEEERKKEVYNDFKGDVVTYVLSTNTFENEEKANKYLEAVKKGTDIKEVALEYSEETVPPKRLGEFTEARLEKYFGKYVRRTITQMKPKSYSAPFNANGKILVLRLDEILSEYKDVKYAVETLIAEAEAPQYMFDLVGKTEIESPFIDPILSDFKEDTPGPFETPPPPSPTPPATIEATNTPNR
jgi:hypothetical protein